MIQPFMSFDQSIDEITMGLDLADKRIRQAVWSATQKTKNHAMSKLRKIVAEASDVKQKVLKQRKRFNIRRKRRSHEDMHFLWVGTNPINARHLNNGKYRKGKYGIWAGKHEFEDAFISRGGAILQRTAGGKLKTPRLEIHRDILAAINKLDEKEIYEFFERTLEHELEYRLSK